MISVNVLHDLLLIIGLEVSKSQIAHWGLETRDKVQRYCVAVHLRASDNIVQVPAKPKVLLGKRVKEIGLTGPSVMDMGVK